MHVGRNDTREQVWEIKLTESTDSIRQPVRYGVAPLGTRGKPAIPLVPGAEYELSVGRVEIVSRLADDHPDWAGAIPRRGQPSGLVARARSAHIIGP